MPTFVTAICRLITNVGNNRKQRSVRSWINTKQITSLLAKILTGFCDLLLQNMLELQLNKPQFNSDRAGLITTSSRDDFLAHFGICHIISLLLLTEREGNRTLHELRQCTDKWQ